MVYNIYVSRVNRYCVKLEYLNLFTKVPGPPGWDGGALFNEQYTKYPGTLSINIYDSVEC